MPHTYPTGATLKGGMFPNLPCVYYWLDDFQGHNMQELQEIINTSTHDQWLLHAIYSAIQLWVNFGTTV